MRSRVDSDRLAVLVHEVRSPVAALAAISQTLREIDGRGGARTQLVALALSACDSIERLLVDTSVASLRRERVDVGEIASAVAETARLGGARVELRVRRPLPPVDGDPVRLRQALANLVSNAAVHGDPEAAVRIAVDADSGLVRMSVSDVGPGIPAIDQERVFEAGVRLDASQPGSGLGLAIVSAIAAAHGGDVTVLSTPSEGTTFTIALPVASTA